MKEPDIAAFARLHEEMARVAAAHGENVASAALTLLLWKSLSGLLGMDARSASRYVAQVFLDNERFEDGERPS